MNTYFNVNGIRVWQFEVEGIDGKMDKVTEYGTMLLFACWLQDHAECIDDPIAWDGLGVIVTDVIENTSGIRGEMGNRLDIHRHYEFSGDLEFSNLYYHKNGLVYAGVYDRKKDKFVGYVEVSC